MQFPTHFFQDVEPFLELRDSGPTYKWCSEVAREHECYVVASFPERTEDGESAYLSQMVVDKEGRVVGVHRKGFEIVIFGISKSSSPSVKLYRRSRFQ